MQLQLNLCSLADDTIPPNISTPNTLNFFTIQSGAVATATIKESNLPITTTDSSAKSSKANREAASGIATVATVIGIIIAILIVLIGIAAVALALYLRKSTRHKQDYDLSYSTLCRGDTQQIQPQSLNAPTDLYDQIQLSPSTGQAEVISKNEAENTNSLLPHQNEPSLNIDTEPCKVPVIKEQSTVSTSEQPTYAAVKKKQKKSKLMKGKKSGQAQNNANEEQGDEVPQCSHTAADKTDIIQEDQIKQGEAILTSLHTVESPEALYTAVKKKPKDNVTETHTIEDLYTAVMKKPKDDPTDSDIEVAPPLPPHTVEELYTAVQKKPKGSAMEDEEDAPPIPPHTVEDYY